MTGGSLLSMMKFASKFARGDSKKQEQDMLAPQTSTHYVKGDRMRTDHTDGTSQIIDVGKQRVLFVDNNKKTYAVATFDQIRASAWNSSSSNYSRRRRHSRSRKPRQLRKPQVTITPTVKVTPGTTTRTILDLPTNETKVEIDLVMQCANPCPDQQQQPNQPNPNDVSATYAMKMDTFVAPSFPGYKEFAKFYRRMGDEVSWMKLPPANIQKMPMLDPRVTQGMSELQKNSDALKGFPMLSYVTMDIVATVNGQTVNMNSQNTQQQQPPPNPPPAQSNPNPDYEPGRRHSQRPGRTVRQKEDAGSSPGSGECSCSKSESRSQRADGNNDAGELLLAGFARREASSTFLPAICKCKRIRCRCSVEAHRSRRSNPETRNSLLKCSGSGTGVLLDFFA